MIKIWTDGACKGNPGGPGGWAALIEEENGERREISGGDPSTTNNIMELTAAIEALASTEVGATIEICSDSQYVVKGITEWITKWVQQGWQSSSGKPVKNQEYWKRLYKLHRNRNVTWLWVRGHAGHEENEIVDKLAVAAKEVAIKEAMGP